MSETRNSPLEIGKEEFREIGYQLIDDISEFICSIEDRSVTSGLSPSKLQKILGQVSLPEEGISPAKLIAETTELLFRYSLLNGHPKFFGYITSSAAPIGAFADMLAATVNSNVGAQILSPIATEIEKQTVKWLAEFIGVSPDYGGILVSGGNMANFTGFLAGRTAKAPHSIRKDGISGASEKLTIYCSGATHTWIEKAAYLFGLGTGSIRWINTTSANTMDEVILEKTLEDDIKNGCKPIMVIGTAGDVSTGAVDNLHNLAGICERYNLWFHVDGAYGAPAAVIPSLRSLFHGISKADSIALDPHKWLYSPLEAGCTLVRNPKYLTDTFSSHPEYYNFSSQNGEAAHNFYEFGLQNSRGFRALKVWLSLRQIGRSGYEKLIREDIELAELLYDLAEKHPELEAFTQNLSITTFRYKPLTKNISDNYLNQLNEELLNKLQAGGELFLSNAVIQEKYCLRTCVVNFRTTKKDIEEIIQIIISEGRKTHLELSG